MLFVLLLFVVFRSASCLNSTCPETVVYETVKDRTWTALVTLESKRAVKGVYLQVELDKPVLVFKNYFAPVSTKNNKVFVIENEEHQLPAASIFYVKIAVNYNGTFDDAEIPQVQKVLFNGKQICPYIQQTPQQVNREPEGFIALKPGGDQAD